MRKADTPHALKVDSKTFEASLNKPDELTQRQCVSNLMGAFHGARMSHPGLTVAVARLASHITTWNAECELRMHRLFVYMDSNKDLVLSSATGEQDLQHAFCTSTTRAAHALLLYHA